VTLNLAETSVPYESYEVILFTLQLTWLIQ